MRDDDNVAYHFTNVPDESWSLASVLQWADIKQVGFNPMLQVRISS